MDFDYFKNKKFRAYTINEVENIICILVEKFNKKVSVDYDYNKKEYCISLTDEDYDNSSLSLPFDVNIHVVYGDSVVYDTPVMIRYKDTNDVYIKQIDSITDEWNEYPAFKIFDKTIKNEKYYSNIDDIEIYSGDGWTNIKKIIKHKSNKKIYRVKTLTGIVDVTEDHSLLKDTYEPVRPIELINSYESYDLLHGFPDKFIDDHVFDDILNSTKDIKTAYINQYLWENDGTFEFESKLDAQRFYYILKNIYKNKNIILAEKDNKYNLKLSSRYSVTKLQSVHELHDCNDYVYDIETECGNFHCGIGELIVKNTDSCFIKFSYNRDNFIENRKDTFSLAELCADKLTNEVFNRPPIVLEFEKIFQPFILLTKKRYIANKYDDIRNPMKLKSIDAKGIAITRRDYCKMVKDCYNKIIAEFMNSDDAFEKSIDIYKSYIYKIENYELDESEIVLTAMLAKDYKTRPVHVLVADKLKSRKEDVQIGDRIPYIFIENESDTKLKKSELGEDPVYARINNLKYNRSCYLEQLAKPLLGFFKIVLNDRQDELDDLINFTNEKIILFGGTKLKPSDFKLPETGNGDK